MSDTKKIVTFRNREFKGSRLRCLLLTHRAPAEVAAFFQTLVVPYAEVGRTETWAPRGFLHSEEVKLGETAGYLSEEDRKTITNWWLAKPGRANTPNWDLVSTCKVGGRNGLILVEAKAHEAEMGADRCGATDPDNIKSIRKAIEDASVAWNQMLPGFALSYDCHYQMSNRFAFAWKVASLGTPVVLVYLGFLDATDMGTSRLLKTDEQWRACVVKKGEEVVPSAVWEKTYDVQGTPLTVLIRSAKVGVYAEVPVKSDHAASPPR